MKNAFRRKAIGLGALLLIGCMTASTGFGGVHESTFYINPDGSNVIFDVRDVSRREVLARLLTSEAIELEWVDAAFADEHISGTYKGSTESVLQRLLAQTNVVVVYNRDGDKPRIARLMIVGKATSQAKSVELPGIDATPPPAARQALPLAPIAGPADFTPPSPQDLAVPLFAPAPPGTPAPALIPPSAAEAALPLFKIPGK